MRDINKLHPSIVLSLKPRDRDYKVSDGGGLYLLVKINGSKYWRLNYRHQGKQKTSALGVFPGVSLAQARAFRDDFDPDVVHAPFHLLRDVFRDYMRIRKSHLTPKHQATVFARCAPVLDALGARPVGSLKPYDFLPHLRQIEDRAQFVAVKVRSDLAQCYAFAVASGLADSNPVRDLSGALKPVRGGHRPALLDPVDFGELLRFIRDHKTVGVVVRAYLLILPHVFVRPGELRLARWKDFDLKNARWTYRMGKVGVDHVVPLSSQVLAMLKDLHDLTGDKEYVFTSVPGDKPITDMTASMILRRGGWSDRHSLHGWRAVARTLLSETLRFPVDIIEHQLGHVVRDALGRAYNRTQFLDDRKIMMQRWSDYVSACF